MNEQTRRKSLTDYERMRDAESQCVPCKLCGGKAVITDAGPGFGYNIECENAARFTQQTCLQSGTRISGWAYNVSDMWNRLNTPVTLAEALQVPEVRALIGLIPEVIASLDATRCNVSLTSDLCAALRTIKEDKA